MFNKSIKNIMSNYIPHETITRNDRDPSRINKDSKQLILDKNYAYILYIRSNKSLQFLNQFQFLQINLSSLNEESNNQYYTRLSQKLLDPKTSQRSYWSILTKKTYESLSTRNFSTDDILKIIRNLAPNKTH